MKFLQKHENSILSILAMLLALTLFLIIRERVSAERELFSGEAEIPATIPEIREDDSAAVEVSFSEVTEEEPATIRHDDADVSDPFPDAAADEETDPGEGPEEEYPCDMYIWGNNVCLMKDPDVGSSVLCYLYTGNIVTAGGQTDSWVNVTQNGISGYVHRDYIRFLPEVFQTDGSAVVELARSFSGSAYKWGGADPEKGFDCSGFVMYIYGSFGISLNRIAGDMALNGVSVEKEELQPGDIILFYSGSQIGHVGIYAGNGEIIHAANEKRGVVTDKLSDFKGTIIYRRVLVD